MKRAVRVLGVTVLSDLVFGIAYGITQHIGVWDGIYFATTTATTVGYGDITPKGWLAHVLAVAIMVTVLPLFTSVFSLISSGLTIIHVDAKHEDMKEHINGKYLSDQAGAGDPDINLRPAGD